MPPEYAIDGFFSVKSDVFSFGVVVLEIVSGRKNKGFFHPEHRLNLLGHVSTYMKEIKASIMFKRTYCFPTMIINRDKIEIVLGMETLERRKGIGVHRYNVGG